MMGLDLTGVEPAPTNETEAGVNVTRREWGLWGLGWTVGLAGAGASKADEPKPTPKPVEPPAFEDFLVIPLRFHVLGAPDLPEIDCRLSDADLTRIVGKVNRIWGQAGIHWDLETIVREPAARLDDFRKASDGQSSRSLDVLRLLAPESSRTGDGLHVYYVHKFSVNGVYLGDRTAFVQETASLRPVEGGIDEPIPRVTAHELGHALGLPHRQDRTNLLASGTNGILLNMSEIERARSVARKVAGVRPAPELKKAAEAALESGDTAKARRLRARLSEIPGAPKST